MTKQDFIIIAQILKELNQWSSHCFDSKDDQLAIANHFANRLAKTNSRFDKQKFIKAII